MSISSDLGPEASTAWNSSISGREDSLGTVPYPSPSKIPLPKCLVESTVRIARSRNELRDRKSPVVAPSNVGICKRDSQENGLSPLYSKSEPRNLYSAARMRGNGDIAVQAALTPISVNTFVSAIMM
ncbi:hypothetical protein M758_2G197500 [Ceratodon purpureus]|nr:hypothetical protein M758_2G197500 [Ceratodon purpureus]